MTVACSELPRWHFRCPRCGEQFYAWGDGGAERDLAHYIYHLEGHL